MSDYIKLQNSVIESSVTKDWSTAKLEWTFHRLYKQNGKRCLCGHYIENICQIINQENGNILEVGNECINQFNNNLEKVGVGLLRLYNEGSSINTPKKVAEFAFKNNIINDYELGFCLNMVGKSRLNENQINLKHRINGKIITHFASTVCQKCNKGKLIERKSKTGVFFLGCTEHPTCNHTENIERISQ